MNRDYPGEDSRDMGAPGALGSAGASVCVGARLPGWETFAIEDRQILVRVLIHIARRQVPLHASPPLTERG